MSDGGDMISTDLGVPEWMNEKSFFEKIIYNIENEEVKVQHMEIKLATEKGDNFSSVLFRVHVSYQSQSEGSPQKALSLIVKIMPFVESFKKEVMDAIGYNMFATEIQMYSEIIPKFEKMLHDSGDETLIGGRCFYTSMEPELVLIFEDLTEIGYKTAKWEGSWDIAWKAVEKLGRWHALSYVEAANSGNEFQNLSKNYYVGDLFLTFPVYCASYKLVLEMLECHSELSEYIPKFQKIISGDPLRKVQELFKAFANGNRNVELYVLNHSDVNIKNLMYKESEDGKIEDVKLIDFQLCMWGPAVIDLILVFYMILDHKSRIHRRNEIVFHYFSVFTETLKRLNFDGSYPKLTDIYKDLITCKDFEVLLACAILPMIITMDLRLESEEYAADDNLRREFYRHPEYVNVMKELLPYFLHRGYLD